MNNVTGSSLSGSTTGAPPAVAPVGFSAVTPGGTQTNAVLVSLSGIQPEREPSDQDRAGEYAREMRGKQFFIGDDKRRIAEQMANARETAEAQGSHARDMQTAMEIASRIRRGDNVPQSDKNFLIRKSPGKFMMAMSSRDFRNENPENHDALARDDDSRRTATPNAGAAISNTAASVAVSAAPSGQSSPRS